MPTVAELTAPYGNFMLGPRAGPGVCDLCCDLINGETRCRRCRRHGAWLDAVAPVSYSVAHEQLHYVLAGYKRLPAVAATRLQLELSGVLWRYLAGHERCLAAAAGTSGFDIVTAIPSSDPSRNAGHPLARMLATQVGPARDRFIRTLEPTANATPPAEATPTADATPPRAFSLDKFHIVHEVADQRILLIDDTWTTGASAFSAAAILKQAGAESVAALVIGRHLHRGWRSNDRRLQRLRGVFDWDRCALEPDR